MLNGVAITVDVDIDSKQMAIINEHFKKMLDEPICSCRRNHIERQTSTILCKIGNKIIEEKIKTHTCSICQKTVIESLTEFEQIIRRNSNIV